MLVYIFFLMFISVRINRKVKKKNIDTKQSNKRNNQNSKSKRQDDHTK